MSARRNVLPALIHFILSHAVYLVLHSSLLLPRFEIMERRESHK